MRTVRALWRQRFQLCSTEDILSGRRNDLPPWTRTIAVQSPALYTRCFATAESSGPPRHFAKERKQYAGELHSLRVEWQQRRLEAQKLQKEAMLKRQQKRLAARSQQQAESDEARAEKKAVQAQRRVARLEQQVALGSTPMSTCITASQESSIAVCKSKRRLLPI